MNIKDKISLFETKKKESLDNFGDSKIGMLVNGKNPIYGSNKIGEIESRKNKENKMILYNYPFNIEYSANEEPISILFVGPSSSGKSTFINAYVNHLVGITDKDNIRYKLIYGDTQSQTDCITIYNIRSLKYNNKLFKLIRSPGFSDLSYGKVDAEKMEKEFLALFKKLFTEDIGQLNSIVFVLKSSENRFNAFLKKIAESVMNLFADDIRQNCLSILTFADNEDIPDAAQVMEKYYDIFNQKSKKNEEWYFSVNSTSYFVPFKLSCPTASFIFTESSLIKFTNKLLSFKVCLTKQTKKKLELKNREENIIKSIKENILTNIIKLKDTEINLIQKINECIKQQEEIEKIKIQISHEEYLEKLLPNNLDTKIIMLKEFEEDNIKNEEELKKIKSKMEKVLKKLDEKNLLIQKKNQQISYLTKSLENVHKNEIKNLQEENGKIQKELDACKYNAIKQFLIIKIINEEIKKLTLNKATTTYSVTELIYDLLLDKKFINNKQYFDEIINEYEKVAREIDNSNNPNQIYKRYDLNYEVINKI